MTNTTFFPAAARWMHALDFDAYNALEIAYFDDDADWIGTIVALGGAEWMARDLAIMIDDDF